METAARFRSLFEYNNRDNRRSRPSGVSKKIKSRRHHLDPRTEIEYPLESPRRLPENRLDGEADDRSIDVYEIPISKRWYVIREIIKTGFLSEFYNYPRIIISVTLISYEAGNGGRWSIDILYVEFKKKKKKRKSKIFIYICKIRIREDRIWRIANVREPFCLHPGERLEPYQLAFTIEPSQ